MTQRKALPTIAMLAIALVYTFPSSGQHNAVADTGPERAMNAQAHNVPTAPVRITDDGRNGDALLPADQLVIAFMGDASCTLAVEILDERGRCVDLRTMTGHAGRNALPVDVSGLSRGRYAVRVHDGMATHVSRFVRE